ncbi:MAG: hypothetical protein K5857_06305 [Lachnospiraceae bacterium]|nr:hypothetical protein [Lachnospiraceae bacterium]
MERLIFAKKKIIVNIFLLFVVGVITCMIPVSGYMPHDLSALFYCTIIILWGLIVKRRTFNVGVRDRVLLSCVFMVFLFFLRMCKFSFFPGLDNVNELIWYAYYIPITAIPLFMFMSSFYVEPAYPQAVTRLLEPMLIGLDLVVCLVVMTNGMHGIVFRITIHPDKEYTYGWFYYLIVAWVLFFGLGTLFILTRKCSLSAARKLWYIPMICVAISCCPLVLYVVNGGALKIMGYKVFQLQEAYCLPFIAGFESVILIGMISANTGYEELFDHSGIRACIFDTENRPVIASSEWSKELRGADRRIRMEPVSGGHVTWVEDLSSIHGLNRELSDIAEQLADENDLIRQENEIRAERVSFETKNRLYNRIATAVRGKALTVNGLLEELGREEDEEKFRRGVIRAAILSAYIKRMGNLMLLTDEGRNLPIEELSMAIRESMDYLGLGGCVCDVITEGSSELPSSLGLLAYELFEAAVEDVWLSVHTVTVMLDCSEGFEMLIAMDTESHTIGASWEEDKIREAGGNLSVRYEDDTLYISLRGEVTP